MVSKMEKIETHFIDDGPYCRLKVDVKTIRKNIVGIKILSYNRKIEFEFDCYFNTFSTLHSNSIQIRLLL